MPGPTTTTTLSNQYQEYFSRKLLQYAVQLLVLAPFGMKTPLPRRSGSTTVRWFRWGEPKTDQIQNLTEGTPIANPASNYRQLELANVDAPLVQYGQVVQITDILTATEFLNSLQQATITNGQDAALHMDDICRDVLEAAATNTTYLSSTYPADAPVTADAVLDEVTLLKINRAPLINGMYAGICGVQVSRDIMKDQDWLEAAKYSNVQALYRGEVGMIHGCRIVETTNPFRSTAEGTYDPAGPNFSSFFLGDQAFGVPDLASQSPFRPSVIITNKADKADPLNQQINIGFKTFWAAKELNTNYYTEVISTGYPA